MFNNISYIKANKNNIIYYLKEDNSPLVLTLSYKKIIDFNKNLKNNINVYNIILLLDKLSEEKLENIENQIIKDMNKKEFEKNTKFKKIIKKDENNKPNLKLKFLNCKNLKPLFKNKDENINNKILLEIVCIWKKKDTIGLYYRLLFLKFDYEYLNIKKEEEDDDLGSEFIIDTESYNEDLSQYNKSDDYLEIVNENSSIDFFSCLN